MRHRQQQSMPFGWVFVVLTTLGAIGGVVTGLSANSIRTSSALPREEPEPFERTQSIPASSIRLASIPASMPAPQETSPAAARTEVSTETSAEWFEEPTLFSPVPAYPMAVAYAPAAAAAAPVASGASNAASQPASQAAAAKPSAQAVAARHAANRPGNVLNDAQIASIKKRLNLTPDQESLWPAVETALRNVSYSKTKEVKVASAGSGPMAYVDTNSSEVQQLKYAAIPLIMRLNDDQKREVKSMAYVMGLESMASGF
jgi:hypothetical protein